MTQYNVTGMSCAACSARDRKGGEQGPGRHVLLGEPADELDGRGGAAAPQDIIAAWQARG